MNIGLLIKRREAEMTQQEVAEIIQISKQSYYLKETGKREFKQSEMIRLSKLFDAKLDELFA